MSAAKKLFIKTYGCQMNVYDSERMVDAMGASGYETTTDVSDADLILLNTCHIREKAGEKVYSDLGRLRKLKKAKPDLLIGVAGCVAQAEGAEIIRRMPIVDLVVGPQTYHRLPDMVRKTELGLKVVDTEFPAEDKFDFLPRHAKTPASVSAFLTIQEGCDKFCSFCVVPYTRGQEVSRPAAKILAEAQELVDRGAVEISLLGQNVNAYANDNWSLAKLIGALAKIDGLARIRYTTSHPKDMSDDLIAAHGDIEKLMPSLHLPVQSGSDRILKAMNRQHRVADYTRTIEKLCRIKPGIALSSDFIVGFPGEEESDFAQTMALCEEIGFAMAYSFVYSPRPGTPAAGREEIEASVKTERLHRLQQLLSNQQMQFQQSMVGKTMPVLIEKQGREPGQMVGKTPWLHSVHLVASELTKGQILPVEIVRSDKNTLAGEYHGTKRLDKPYSDNSFAGKQIPL